MHDTTTTVRDTREPLIAAQFMGALMMLGMSKGVSRAEMLHVLGVSPRVLADPEARVPYRTGLKLWHLLIDRFPADNLGLEMGLMLPDAAFGALHYATRHAPSVGEAIRTYVRYVHYTTSHLRLLLEDDVLTFKHIATIEAVAPIIRCAVVLAARQSRRVSGLHDVAVQVRLKTPLPANREPFDHFFGCEVAFGQPETSLTLAPGLLDKPVPTADKNLFRYIRTHLEAQGPPPTSPSGSEPDRLAPVAAALEELAERGIYHGETLADRLGVSMRTLQRDLRRHGTSVRELLEDHRQRRAKALLAARKLTVDDVAFLLGYSEERAFTRAFKRWTGVTPAQYRKDGPPSS